MNSRRFWIRDLMLLLMLMPASCDATQAGWPKVKAVNKTFEIASANQANVKFDILGINRDPLYRLECHSYLYEGDTSFNYSGEYECRLTSLYSKETVSTLFAESASQTADWESRARFFSNELVGKCAEYPDYGRMRTFDLRGMRIVMQINNPTFEHLNNGNIELKSFDFHLTVAEHINASGSITAPSLFQEPAMLNAGVNNETTRDCSRILRRK